MIQDAIEKAIEGGYEPFFSAKYNELQIKEAMINGGDFMVDVGLGMPYRRDINSILLDPLFWQALGKAEGWHNEEWTTCRNGCQVDGQGEGCHHDLNREGHYRKPFWHYQWRKFIDHLAEGKDIDSFFESLLSNKEKEK